MGRLIPFSVLTSERQNIAEHHGAGGGRVSSLCKWCYGPLRPVGLCTRTRSHYLKTQSFKTKRSRPCDAVSSHRIRYPQERGLIKGRAFPQLQSSMPPTSSTPVLFDAGQLTSQGAINNALRKLAKVLSESNFQRMIQPLCDKKSVILLILSGTVAHFLPCSSQTDRHSARRLRSSPQVAAPASVFW